MKIIKIDCCANCVYLVNSCIHDKFPKDKEINDFSIIDHNCPLEDLKEISLPERLIDFLIWYEHPSISDATAAKIVVDNYLNSINESSGEALMLKKNEEKEKECEHDNTEFKNIRCNVCMDCDTIIEIDV